MILYIYYFLHFYLCLDLETHPYMSAPHPLAATMALKPVFKTRLAKKRTRLYYHVLRLLLQNTCEPAQFLDLLTDPHILTCILMVAEKHRSLWIGKLIMHAFPYMDTRMFISMGQSWRDERRDEWAAIVEAKCRDEYVHACMIAMCCRLLCLLAGNASSA